jgi:hypothetical protein
MKTVRDIRHAQRAQQQLSEIGFLRWSRDQADPGQAVNDGGENVKQAWV